jgi:hypothetical protein
MLLKKEGKLFSIIKTLRKKFEDLKFDPYSNVSYNSGVLSAQNWKKVEHFSGWENLDLKGLCRENPDRFYTFKFCSIIRLN